MFNDNDQDSMHHSVETPKMGTQAVGTIERLWRGSGMKTYSIASSSNIYCVVRHIRHA